MYVSMLLVKALFSVGGQVTCLIGCYIESDTK